MEKGINKKRNMKEKGKEGEKYGVEK